MKKVGMLFEDSVALNAAFYAKAFGVLAYKEDAEVNTGTREIIYPDIKYMFILIEGDRDVNQISGIEFDAIFSEVTNPNVKQYILSRFRPRFN